MCWTNIYITMTHEQFNKIVHSPEIRRITLSYLIGRISAVIAQRLGIAPVDALCRFYESDTCALLHDERTGFYLFSVGYLADEYFEEQKRTSSQ